MWATSANGTCAPSPAIHSANIAAVDAIRAGVLPDITNVLTTGSGCRATGSAAGACSSTTCALVPLTPNEDTPARRARPTDGHAMGCAAMVNRDAPVTGMRSQLLEIQMLGNMPMAHTEHGLDETGDTRQPTPDDPRFVFTEPNTNGAAPSRSAKTWLNASSSIGSPNAVPVPCAST